MFSGLALVLSLIAVVGSKFITTAKLQNLRHLAAQAEAEARSAKGKLKAMETEAQTSQMVMKIKQRKMKVLGAQIEKYKRELVSFE